MESANVAAETRVTEKLDTLEKILQTVNEVIEQKRRKKRERAGGCVW